MKLTIKEMILAALFAALTAVGAKLSVPTPFGISVTFQLFVVFYAGLLLGSKVAALSQVIYILIGLVGIPVFAGPTAGLAYALKPSFGYLVGFIFAAYTIGFLMERVKSYKFHKILLNVFAGFAVAYIFGLGYHYLANNMFLNSPLKIGTLLGFMTPYIIKDFALMVVAVLSSMKVMFTITRAGYKPLTSAK